jgi:hypothetical protein
MFSYILVKDSTLFFILDLDFLFFPDLLYLLLKTSDKSAVGVSFYNSKLKDVRSL